MLGHLRLGGLVALCFWLCAPGPVTALDLTKAEGVVRVASFNANMNRKGAGVLIQDIAKRDPQILTAAEIILRVRPDILLLNEIDHDPEGRALADFVALLAEGAGQVPGFDYPHRFIAPVNTGEPTGFDLNGDGKAMGPEDAYGYGRFPGQYGMALLSIHPLGVTRTFRFLKWAAMPDALRPMNPDGSGFHADEVWEALRLSSKSHWDVSVTLPDGKLVHLLASHPTPPVFDGPENRNGRRNSDEIRFWVDYIDGAQWIVDDAGQSGGLPAASPFVVLGDLNADPKDGEGRDGAIRDLLEHPRVRDPEPVSAGAVAAAASQAGANAAQIGDAARDTADWRDNGGPGNMRVDYVLTSDDLDVTGAGVFWPEPDDPLARLVATRGRTLASSDHRLVWVDISVASE